MGNICIIPARGGSKRIPRKNIKKFLGKPIIAYSIEVALKSKLFDEVMVSTDDEKIASIAKRYGAVVPYMRSSESANDYATLAEVLIEVMYKYNNDKIYFKNICCILPTAPFTSVSQLKEAYSILGSDKMESVCPVVLFSYPILRALEFSSDKHLHMKWPEYLKTRSQDLKPTYHDSGSFCWVTTSALLEQKTLFCKTGGAIILNEYEAQDIDTEADWQLAELKYRLLNEV